jgi:hypothetical protein
MKIRPLLFTTLRGAFVILAAYFFMLMFVDNLLPALGIQLSLKSRQLFIIATVCMSFAWASGSVIKVIRQEQLKDRR